MRAKAFLASLAAVNLLGILQVAAVADTFGSGANSFTIDFVTIGSAGNPADTTGNPNPAGAVPYEYRMGKYEISEQMIDKANALGGLGIAKSDRGPDKPVTYISWFDAARFVNWLNTSTGSVPAYKFDNGGNFQLWTPADPGYDANNLFRNKLAAYILPSADEWYKAAFYDPATNTYFDFPNGSNVAPIGVASGTAASTAVFDQPFEQGPANIMLAGGASPFGTVGQAGNVWEWDESELDLVNDDPQALRGLRGFAWLQSSGNYWDLSSSSRYFSLPWRSIGDSGFRVASSTIPESATLVNLVWGVCLRLAVSNRHRRTNGTDHNCASLVLTSK